MEERRIGDDSQLVLIHDLLKEIRDEQRDAREENKSVLMEQVGMKRDIGQLQGDVAEMTAKVELHHGAYTKGKAMGALIAMVLGWVGWDTIKNHWGKH